MHRGAAEGFGVSFLTDGGLHKLRAGEVEAAALGHEDLVAEDGQVGAAGDAVAHDGGVLRNARGGDDGVVAEDAAEVVLVRKNLVLHRQEHASGVHQVDQRQVALKGDALRAEELLARHRDKRPRLHRGVVRDDHARMARDVGDAGDDARGRKLAPVEVHAVCGPEPGFEEGRRVVDEPGDSLAGEEPAKLVLAGESVGSAALAEDCLLLRDFVAAVEEGVGRRWGWGFHRATSFSAELYLGESER